MKVFAAFLSILFFCLAIVPCADAAPNESHSIELNQEQEQDHEHEGQADKCTPFCHCHCCQVHVTIVNSNKPLVNVPNFHEQVTEYRSSVVNDIKISLFRPPIV